MASEGGQMNTFVNVYLCNTMTMIIVLMIDDTLINSRKADKTKKKSNVFTT